MKKQSPSLFSSREERASNYNKTKALVICIYFFAVAVLTLCFISFRGKQPDEHTLPVNRYISSVEVVFADKTPLVCNDSSTSWAEASGSLLSPDFLMLTPEDSHRNILVFSGIKSLRSNTDTYLSFKNTDLPGGGASTSQVELKYGEIWVEGSGEQMVIEIPNGAIVSDGGDFQASLGRDGAVLIICWKGNVKLYREENGKKTSWNVGSGRILEGSPSISSPEISEVSGDLSPWQRWNRDVSIENIAAGGVLPYPGVISGERPEDSSVSFNPWTSSGGNDDRHVHTSGYKGHKLLSSFHKSGKEKNAKGGKSSDEIEFPTYRDKTGKDSSRNEVSVEPDLSKEEESSKKTGWLPEINIYMGLDGKGLKRQKKKHPLQNVPDRDKVPDYQERRGDFNDVLNRGQGRSRDVFNNNPVTGNEEELNLENKTTIKEAPGHGIHYYDKDMKKKIDDLQEDIGR